MDLPSPLRQPNGHMSTDVPTNNGYGEDNQLVAAAQAANAAGDVSAGNAEAVSSPWAAAEAEAARHNPSSLLDDTEFPDEPVTTGLDVGPGRGPEALGVPTVSRVARTLDVLANATGNPVLASLAGEAASRNL